MHNKIGKIGRIWAYRRCKYSVCAAGVFLALFFVSCVVDKTDTALTDVTVTAESSSVDATGSVTLTATVETVGNPELSYTWSIKSDSSYATISGDGATATLTGINTTASEQTVTAKVTVSDNSNNYTYSDSVAITVGAAASAVTAVSISASSRVSWNATPTLTAVATVTNNASLSYTWEITSGSDYAYFGSSGTTTTTTTDTTVTLTANNTSSSEQAVTITVTAVNQDDDSNTASGTATVKLAAYGEEVAGNVTGVSLSAASTSISNSGSTTLTATPEYDGEPKITYTWSITSGTDYATVSGDGMTATLTGTNSTTSAQSVTVQVSASDGTNSQSATAEITVAAKKSVSSSYNATATVDSAYSSVIYLDVGNALVSSDNANWSEITTSAVEPVSNVKVKFTEDDAGDSTGLIRINAASFSGDLAVYISGTNDSSTVGGVKIQSNASDTIALFLNDAVITSTNYPCVEVTKGSPAVVDMSGTNTFTDGRSYGTGYGEEYSTTSGATYTDDDGNTVSCTVVKAAVSEGSDSKGTLYCKGNLTVSGDGSLSVKQAYKNCIATKDGTLTINGGTFTLKNYTYNSTTPLSSYSSIQSSGTGKNGLFGGAGIVVNDGTITFYGCGIISKSSSYYDIRKANAFKTDDDDYTSSAVTINGGTINVTTYNGKGITAPYVNITCGTNTFTVAGVTTYAENTATGSYYDADGVLQTNQTIKFAAEGIEGASQVKISGGTIEVTATDDAVNVSNTGGKFTMSDGSLYTYSTGGDGVDSNGNIAISGGTIVSYAPIGSEDALDCGDGSYSISITGGLIAGVCGSSNGVRDISTSGQKVLYFTGSTSQNGMRAPTAPSGNSSSSSFSKVAVYVSGSCVYAFTLPTSSFGLCLLSSPSFTSSSSSTYKVYTSPTFSGGTEFNGLYTTLPTVTTGSSTTTPSIK